MTERLYVEIESACDGPQSTPHAYNVFVCQKVPRVPGHFTKDNVGQLELLSESTFTLATYCPNVRLADWIAKQFKYPDSTNWMYQNATMQVWRLLLPRIVRQPK